MYRIFFVYLSISCIQLTVIHDLMLHILFVMCPLYYCCESMAHIFTLSASDLSHGGKVIEVKIFESSIEKGTRPGSLVYNRCHSKICAPNSTCTCATDPLRNESLSDGGG